MPVERATSYQREVVNFTLTKQVAPPSLTIISLLGVAKQNNIPWDARHRSVTLLRATGEFGIICSKLKKGISVRDRFVRMGRALYYISCFTALFGMTMVLPHPTVQFVATVVTLVFPLFCRFVLRKTEFEEADKMAMKRDTRAFAVALVGMLTLSELLLKRDSELKHRMELLACIIVSNSSLLTLRKGKPRRQLILESSESSDVQSDVRPPSAIQNLDASDATGEFSINKEVTLLEMTEVQSAMNTSDPSTMLVEDGNGRNQPLTDKEVQLIATLHKKVIEKNTPKYAKEGVEKELTDYCDFESCRRVLVARGWSMNKAQNQLQETIDWRLQNKPWLFHFKDSPICKKNPYAFTLRIAGFDQDKRPILFTTFQHALDRFHVESNVEHFQLLLEEARRIIAQRFRKRETTKANQVQWILVIDFVGFSVRDTNPYTAYLATKLMLLYPEMLNRVLLVDAPLLFSGVWNMIQSVIDDRVRSKVAFTSLNKIKAKFAAPLGDEAVDWIEGEIRSSRAHKSSQGKRAYWQVQSDGQDSRGISSYLSSPYYVETPGDAWGKAQQAVSDS